METPFQWVIVGVAAVALVALIAIYWTDILLAAACLFEGNCL